MGFWTIGALWLIGISFAIIAARGILHEVRFYRTLSKQSYDEQKKVSEVLTHIDLC